MTNVLVITTDDQRYDELAYMPNTRKLMAGAGTSFTGCRANVGLCSPTRAGILTGQYSKYHNVSLNTDNLTNTAVTGQYQNSAFVAIHNAGVRTGMVGKFFTALAGQQVKPGFDFWRTIVGDGGSGFGIYEPDTYVIYDGSSNISPGMYQDHYLAGQAIDFMRGPEPWCLWYCSTSDHWPWTNPPNHQTEWEYRAYPFVTEADVSDKPSWIQSKPAITQAQLDAMQLEQRMRLRELLAVDDAVGAFVSMIQATGLADNTTIMFCSDNGNVLGEHRIIGVGALAGTKNVPYDVSMHTPLLALGPNFPQKTVTQPTTHQDITATMLDLFGATPLLPNQAGISLRSIAANPAAYGGRQLLHRRVQDTVNGDTIPTADGISDVRYTLWKYAGQTGTDQYEFYDRQNDPNEWSNLANQAGSLALRNTYASALAALLA